MARRRTPKKKVVKRSPAEGGSLTVARNRRATYDYAISQRFEAGLVLLGTEIKSLREGKGSIAEAYIRPDGNELLLVGANIPPYASANRLNHEPTRDRKLLLHKREIRQAIDGFEQKGLTLIPVALFINARGLAKLSFGIGRGKRQYEKRQSIAKRDAERQMQAALRR
ncbi:MAG: SsrA-binding protein SmpB [Chloroflexi bacterium]|nr:SsrA-binding protein SmpB [Chloroflexota bacterium]